MGKKYHGAGKGKLVIINLQPTKHDKKADLIIRCYADKVMEKVFAQLGHSVPDYDTVKDPTKSSELVEWTQSVANAKQAETLSRIVEQDYKAELKRKKLLKNLASEASEPKPQVDHGSNSPGSCGGDAKKPKLEEEVKEEKPKAEKVDVVPLETKAEIVDDEEVKAEPPLSVTELNSTTC